MQGTMYWDGNIGRYDIRSKNGEEHGGLHAGDQIDLLLKGEWVRTRIEYNHDEGYWYLKGFDRGESDIHPNSVMLYGIPVRFAKDIEPDNSEPPIAKAEAIKAGKGEIIVSKRSLSDEKESIRER